MLDFRSFEIVSTVLAAGSLSAASVRLAMQQPALTKALASIEAEIGTKLFHRSAAGMNPTPQAEIFLRRWDGIVRELVDMRREIDRLNDMDDGLLRIAKGYLAATSAEMAIGVLKQRFPSLLIEARQTIWSDVAALVRRGAVDIGVADPAAAESDRSLHIEMLSVRDSFFICRGGHPLVHEPAPTLDMILSFPLAINLIPAQTAQYLPDDLLSRGYRRTDEGHLLPPIAVQSISAIRNILLNSDAVSLMPKQNLGSLFRSGRLVRLERLSAPWLKDRLAFITRANTVRSPAMAAFIDEVRRIEHSTILDHLEE